MTTSRDRMLDGIAAMLETNGISLDELQRHLDGGSASTVTLQTFLDAESPKLDKDTRRTYLTSLNRLADGAPPHCECACEKCCNLSGGCACTCRSCRSSKLTLHPLGDRALSSITFTELESAVVVAQRIAIKRATTRNRKRAEKGRSAMPDHGKGSAETAVRAARWMFERARLCGYVSSNPAADLKVPRRNPSNRRALVGDEFTELFDTVASGGGDPELDVKLVWFHAETGARRDGAINLTCGDLDDARQMIRLREKFKVVRDQPVSDDLIAALRELAIARGGERCDPDSPLYDRSMPVFWYKARGSRPARRLTDRRYDTLFGRIQTTLPWADKALLTAHNLRHTGATLVERLAGTQVARRFLGHADRSVTEMYTDADEAEVARAVSRLTGRPHPLAD